MLKIISLKPLIGKFTYRRFLNFEVIMPFRAILDLYIVVKGLYSVDRTDFPINALSYRYMCKVKMKILKLTVLSVLLIILLLPASCSTIWYINEILGEYL